MFSLLSNANLALYGRPLVIFLFKNTLFMDILRVTPRIVTKLQTFIIKMMKF
jgi:hypothetical protein